MNNNSDFLKYRDIAPANVSDERIRQLMERSNGDVNSITVGIQNMWQDIPDSKAINTVGDWDLTSTDKRKLKKKPDPVSNGHGSKHKIGEAKEGARGDKRDSDRPKERERSSARAPAISKIALVSDYNPEPAAVIAPSSTPSSTAVSTGSTWGSASISLAEKLKQAEMSKLAAVAAETAIVAEPPAIEIKEMNDGGEGGDVNSSKIQKRNRNSKRGGKPIRDQTAEDLVPGTDDLMEMRVESKLEIIDLSALEADLGNRAETPPGFYNSSSSNTMAFNHQSEPQIKISTVDDFKMPITYEIEIDAPLDDDFQFGSVGLKESVTPQASSWLGDTGVSASGWNSNDKNGSMGLFDSSAKVPLSVGADPSHKSMTTPPPGLELPSSKIQGQTPRGGQQRKSDNAHSYQGQQQSQQQYQQHHYGQNAVPVRGTPVMSEGMGMGIPPYQYAGPTFDSMGQSQFPQHYAPVAVNPAIPNPSIPPTGGSTQSAPQYPQPPPGINNGYPPFQGNPYYNNQYFYANQGAYFYGQPNTRGIYPPAQYAGGAQGGSMYPDMYGQAPNQFSEAGPYGGMPMMAPAPTGVTPNQLNSGKGAKNNSAIGGTTGSSVNGGLQGSNSGPDMMAHQYQGNYGMPYPRDQWVMHQQWGNNMIPMPANTPGVGFNQSPSPNPGQPVRGDGNVRPNPPGYAPGRGSNPGSSGNNNWTT